MTATDGYIPVITPVPDDNTSEAIMYGPAYKYAKSSKWYLDELEEVIDNHIEELKAQLNDTEFAAAVMRRSPMLIYARSPPVSDPSKIRDLWTLRQIVNYGSAKQEIKVMRMTAELYCTMQGVDQHAQQYIAGGVSESMWKTASLGFDAPIEYETIRTVKDQDERAAAADAENLYAEMDSERRRLEAARIDSQVRDYMSSIEGDEEDDDGDDDADVPAGIDPSMFRIYHEYEVDDEGDLPPDARPVEPPKAEEPPEEAPRSSAMFDAIYDTVSDYLFDGWDPFLRSLEEFSASIMVPAPQRFGRRGVRA